MVLPFRQRQGKDCKLTIFLALGADIRRFFGPDINRSSNVVADDKLVVSCTIYSWSQRDKLDLVFIHS